MGKTQGLRKLMIPAVSAMSMAGKSPRRSGPNPNMTQALICFVQARHLPVACEPCHKVVDALKHVAYLELMTDKNFLDATGLLCPLPVLKAA